MVPALKPLGHCCRLVAALLVDCESFASTVADFAIGAIASHSSRPPLQELMHFSFQSNLRLKKANHSDYAASCGPFSFHQLHCLSREIHQALATRTGAVAELEEPLRQKPLKVSADCVRPLDLSSSSVCLGASQQAKLIDTGLCLDYFGFPQLSLENAAHPAIEGSLAHASCHYCWLHLKVRPALNFHL